MATRSRTRGASAPPPAPEAHAAASPRAPRPPSRAAWLFALPARVDLALLLTALTPLFLVRAHLDQRYVPYFSASLATAAVIARGFASDLVVAALFAAGAGAALALHRRSAKVRALVLGLSTLVWSFVASGNHEHIRVNYANADLAFWSLGLSRTFIDGSALSASVLSKLAAASAVTAVLVLLVERRRTRRAPTASSASTSSSAVRAEVELPRARWAIALAALALLFAVPVDVAYPEWLAADVLEGNLLRAAAALRPHPYKAKALEPELRAAYFSPDLSGEPRVELPPAGPRKTNVLVVMIEGLSRTDFERGRFPRLRARAEQALFLSNLVENEKQTNRGLYSLLCGDYENLIDKEAKADLIGVHGAKRACLPEQLHELGWTTTFMEGSPLGFMRKDLFGAAAGFEHVFGSETLTDAYARGSWGIDDRALFEHVVRELDSLRDAGQPWMMGVLTSGTHHPYNVPAAAVAHPGDATLQDAQAYADRALDELLDTLARRGTLKDTLVLVTGDEATPDEVGLTGGTAWRLASNRSVLLALTPRGDRGEVTEPYLQTDVALSVRDYLGVGAGETIGRSFFRRYASGRSLVFANVLTSTLHLLRPDGRLLRCPSDLRRCETFEGLDATRSLPTTEADVKELERVAAFSDLGSEDLDTRVVFEELSRPHHGPGFILGNHKLAPKPGDRLTWTLRLKASPANRSIAGAWVLAYVPPKEAGEAPRFLFREYAELLPGQALELRRSYVARLEDDWIWSNMEIVGAKDLEVVVDAAQLQREKQGEWVEDATADRRRVIGTRYTTRSNLLESPYLAPCLAAIEGARVAGAECPRGQNVLDSYPLTLRAGRRIAIELDVEGVAGEATLSAGLLRESRVIETDGPRTLKAGEAAKFRLEYQQGASDGELQYGFAIMGGTSDAAVKLRSATLAASEPE